MWVAVLKAQVGTLKVRVGRLKSRFRRLKGGAETIKHELIVNIRVKKKQLLVQKNWISRATKSVIFIA